MLEYVIQKASKTRDQVSMVNKVVFYSLDITSQHNNIVHKSLNIQLLQAVFCPANKWPQTVHADQMYNVVLDILVKCESTSAKGTSPHNWLAIFKLQPFYAIFRRFF